MIPRRREVWTNGVFIQDQNFTVVCDDGDSGTVYQTAYEGSTGNWTQHCSPTPFDAAGACDGRIATYDSLGENWPPSDWVLLASTTCEDDFGPCDVYGPEGGSIANNSFAFVKDTATPLYVRGCYDRWCSTIPFRDYVAGAPPAGSLDPDAACAPPTEAPWCCSSGVAPESDCAGLDQHDCEFHLPQCAWGPCPPAADHSLSASSATGSAATSAACYEGCGMDDDCKGCGICCGICYPTGELTVDECGAARRVHAFGG